MSAITPKEGDTSHGTHLDALILSVVFLFARSFIFLDGLLVDSRVHILVSNTENWQLIRFLLLKQTHTRTPRGHSMRMHPQDRALVSRILHAGQGCLMGLETLLLERPVCLKSESENLSA